jgi:hypothetical protein
MSEIVENIKDKSLRESLYKNYENSQEMIRFAETKNAAIIATAGAILSLTFDKLHFTTITNAIFSSGYFFLVASMFISFWSLYPIYPLYSVEKIEKLRDKPETEGKKLNLYVFSNISQFPDHISFAKAIESKYYPNEPLTLLEKDVVASLYVSSNIARRKFVLFKYSLIVRYKKHASLAASQRIYAFCNDSEGINIKP